MVIRQLCRLLVRGVREEHWSVRSRDERDGEGSLLLLLHGGSTHSVARSIGTQRRGYNSGGGSGVRGGVRVRVMDQAATAGGETARRRLLLLLLGNANTPFIIDGTPLLSILDDDTSIYMYHR
jgi:hypothetical protein